LLKHRQQQQNNKLERLFLIDPCTFNCKTNESNSELEKKKRIHFV